MFRQTPNNFELNVIDGKIQLAQIEIGIKILQKKVTLDNKAQEIAIQSSKHLDAVIIQFKIPLELGKDQQLKIE